jgi:adenosylcobyric acid synthase
MDFQGESLMSKALPGHGGNIRYLAAKAGLAEGEIIDFSASINPLGPPEWLRQLISSKVSALAHYPDPDSTSLVEAISSRYSIPSSEVLVGNGSTEILHIIPRAFKVSRAVIPVPAYTDYIIASELAELTVDKIPLEEETGFVLDLFRIESRLRGNELVFIGQPNNPTGLIVDADEIRNLARRHAETLFIVDEAFADFVEGMDRLISNRPDNVIVLCSLTKFFAIPGMRLGFAAGAAQHMAAIKRLMPPWSVNTFAQAIGEAALADVSYAGRTRDFVRREKEHLTAELASIPGLTVYPGVANFLLVKVDRNGTNAGEIAGRLLGDGIAIRVCDNFHGLDARFFRMAVRTETENTRLCDALNRILNQTVSRPVRLKRPAIMIQGTSSNAGKSVLVAALCRILLQDGYRVAPFKSQNMSLNSYVTREGGEMGRAQVVQSQACRLEPDVRMNPILLKPSSDTGAQVIILGKPVGNMGVAEYIKYKPQAFETAKEAYDSLARGNDVIVLEGAGSPAEVNLKHHDIVNMHMAAFAGSPVLLVGDIDRGGVFASFVGTMEVLDQWERALVKGFLINRFRGEETLLNDAIDYTLQHTGLPTLGIIPYLHALGLPEEDSVTFKACTREDRQYGKDTVEIAVIDLPHISNFTDLDALKSEPDVHVKIIRKVEDLQKPVAIILPGSKNVIADLEYLRGCGLARRIIGMAQEGKTEVIGICGGFQILGDEIADPLGIETSCKTVKGLFLMPITTELLPDKTLRAVTARHIDSGHGLRGYEIHHGRTNGYCLSPAIVREDGEVIGSRSENGLIWGTYLHGVFDADDFRRWFIDRLRIRNAMPPIGRVVAPYDLEPALDRLADVVRDHVNIKEIYRLMGL